MKIISMKLSLAYKLASSMSSMKKTMLPIRVSLLTLERHKILPAA